MLKVVLDTNVLINGVQDEFSYANRIINAIIEGKMLAIVSPRIVRENTRLAERLITDDEYMDKLEDFYDVTKVVMPVKHLRLSSDRDDDKFLDAAIEGSANFIVSDDSDLLDLGEVDGVRVVAPEEFWNIYSDGDETEERSAWSEWASTMGIG